MFITPYHRSRSIAPQGTLTLLDSLNWVDQLFKDNWEQALSSSLTYDEKTKAYTTELDLAGYKKDEIKVEVEDGQVTVSAENEKRGKAVRSFYVSDADADKIDAKLDHGVLTLSVPRRPEKVPRQVTIS